MAEGKKILSELFEKASELSSFLSGSSAGGGSNSSACGRNGGSAAASEIVHGSSGGTSGTRNYMPSFRRQFLNGGRPRSKRSKGQGKNIASGPFMRDVILLTSPDINTVPRQGNRVWLMENGYVISGFQMHKEWSECQVVASLIEAFGDKLPHNVDVEIVMPVHSTLVKPTLPPGQGLNGIMAHRIFKEKPLYLRPSKEICPDILPSRKRPRRFGFEDVDSTCDSSANVSMCTPQ